MSVKSKIAYLFMVLRLSTTWCQLSYGITQCYLPLDTLNTLHLNPTRQEGIRFTYRSGIEG